MKNHLKKIVAASLLGTFLLTQSSPAQASIPVIDSENIMQQIKTYTETLNVVSNTAQQIELQIKELTGLSDDTLNKYKTAVQSSIASVTSSLKKSNFFTESSDWDNYWRSTFPRISGGTYSQTILSEQDARTTMQEMLSLKNQRDVSSYHDLVTELDASKSRLQDLLELNQSPEGSKQAAQIANEIAVEKAHIESINAALQAITSQNQAMKNQADVLEKQNHQAVIDASIQAENEAISTMDKEVTKTTPVLDDPWSTYGKVRW